MSISHVHSPRLPPRLPTPSSLVPKPSFSIYKDRESNERALSMHGMARTPRESIHLPAVIEPSAFAKFFGRSSPQGATVNLVVATVGTGILSFPFAMRASGVVCGIILLIICTWFAYISLKILVIASEYNESPKLELSYLSLSLQCGGKKLAIFTQINVTLALIGAAISQMVGAGGIIVILLKHAEIPYISLDDADVEKKYYTYIVVAFTGIIFPLSLMRNMSSLRFTSLLSVLCSLFLTICITTQYFRLCGNHGTCFWNRNEFLTTFKDDSYLASFTFNGFVTAIPIFIFCLNCHPNVFPIYHAFSDQPSSNRIMNRVFKEALSISVLLYTLVGAFAFLVFLDDTCGNILTNDFKRSDEIVLASVVFAASRILAVPVFVHAIRENVNDILFHEITVSSTLRHFLVTMCICCVCALITVAADDLELVFGFIGSTTAPITGFVLPTFFVWKLVPKEHSQHKMIKIIALIIMFIVILISIGSLYYKIWVIATGVNATCDTSQTVEDNEVAVEASNVILFILAMIGIGYIIYLKCFSRWKQYKMVSIEVDEDEEEQTVNYLF